MAVVGGAAIIADPAHAASEKANRLTIIVKVKGRWQVGSSSATTLNANTVPEDPTIAALIRPAHEKVLAYVNSVIGTCTQAMSAATSRYEDTAAMDFINQVQAQEVKAHLTGAAAGLPVLSIAAPFNKAAAIPQGSVTVRDVAGLYIYDNTLLGIQFSGAQVKAYLEKSAEYFKPVPGPGTYAAADVTNAATVAAPNGTPDYNYDIIWGLDARLTYDIDLAAPVGSRVVGLSYDGAPVADSQQFGVAINNYRQSGGGGFPGVTTAPVVYNKQLEIRQLIIDWVTAHGVVDPPSFFTIDWKLTASGTPLTITP